MEPTASAPVNGVTSDCKNPLQYGQTSLRGGAWDDLVYGVEINNLLLAVEGGAAFLDQVRRSRALELVLNVDTVEWSADNTRTRLMI